MRQKAKKISRKSLTNKNSQQFHGTGNTIARVHELLGGGGGGGPSLEVLQSYALGAPANQR